MWQEHSPAPCLLQPLGKLVNVQCQGLPQPLPAGASAHSAHSAWKALTTPLAWLASPCPSDSWSCSTSFRKPSLTAWIGGPLPGFITVCCLICAPFIHPDFKRFKREV